MTSLAEAGARLRAAREAQGLTLDAVAARTRLPVKHIEALEAGDAAALPEPFYVRSFLKKYAEVVGLDPAEVALQPAPAVEAAQAAKEPAPAAWASLLRPFLPGLSYGAVALALVAGGYLAWRMQPRVSPIEASPTPAATPSPSPPPSPSALPATPSPGAEPASGAVVASPAALAASPAPASASPGTGQTVLELEIVQRSWLEVKADGRTLFEDTLPAGTRKSFTARGLRVTVGNAGGVRFRQDGGAWAPLGVTGQVVSRRFEAR